MEPHEINDNMRLATGSLLVWSVQRIPKIAMSDQVCVNKGQQTWAVTAPAASVEREHEPELEPEGKLEIAASKVPHRGF